MSCGWMLALVSLLLLACPGLAHGTLDYPFFIENSEPQSQHYEKRYDDIDYDSFVGLMGRRNAEANRDTNPHFRTNMNDIFVGLLGRRNTRSDIPAWRRERRGNIFVKGGRLRFCCGI